LTFREASRIAYMAKGTIVGTGKYKPPPLGGAFKGAAVGTSPAYGCSAQVVEVEVDLETGKIVIEKMTDAHDCGRAINRTSVEGQMEGSLAMGMGEACSRRSSSTTAAGSSTATWPSTSWSQPWICRR
jgi:CO/xanthine dehydrogenase Mo-binding subunit